MWQKVGYNISGGRLLINFLPLYCLIFKFLFVMSQTIIERIDEIRANSVTDAEFKKMWGISIDEHVNKLMKWVKEFDAKH